MKKIFLLLSLLVRPVFAANDCGISTINLYDQSSIISVQQCIKDVLTNLKTTLQNNETVLDNVKAKAQSIINEEALCGKYESYYNNAKDDYGRKLYKGNVTECYAILNQRAEKVAGLTGEYQELKSETKKTKQMILALQNRYDMITNQLDFLKK
jgi:hypothetical protein